VDRIAPDRRVAVAGAAGRLGIERLALIGSPWEPRVAPWPWSLLAKVGDEPIDRRVIERTTSLLPYAAIAVPGRPVLIEAFRNSSLALSRNDWVTSDGALSAM